MRLRPVLLVVFLFSGGIGKIRGAVIGTIIFTGIIYTLTYLGYDPNIQFIFKGIIIMAAVCLDSLNIYGKNNYINENRIFVYHYHAWFYY